MTKVEAVDATTRAAETDGPLLRSRDSPFGYTCHQCNRCCYGRRITVNPYELVRLASNLGIGTAGFIEAYTADRGATLRRRGDGACVFLGEEGCTVHRDRPLACRLYPLGCVTLPDGSETFVELEPHPETEGVYSTEGSVGDYLRAQETGPYLEAAARYRSLLRRMLDALEPGTRATEPGGTRLDDADGAEPYTEWLDVDAVVAGDAGNGDPPASLDPWRKMLLHIEALEALLDG